MNYSDVKKIHGLQFIPVKKDKKPIPQGWQNTIKDYDLSNCPKVGLVCGSPSGNVEVIDIDCKYDLTGTLYRDYKRAIHEIDSEILKKVVVQKTVSNGYPSLPYFFSIANIFLPSPM